jgi:cytochrome c556
MRSLSAKVTQKMGMATLAGLGLLLVSVSTVHAQEVDAETKAIDNRQAVFKLIGWSFDPVGKMLKNQMKYDAATVQKSAARLEVLAPMITEAFATDTRGKAAGVKTKAREGIWTNNADFKAKNDDLIKAVAGLSAASKGADEKAFKQAAAAVGKACGACHDSFRDK